jgi:hypothetical protein
MSEIEKKKITAEETLMSLCPRCQRHEEHSCPVAGLVREIRRLKAVPIRVNDQLYSVMFL